MKRVQGFLFTPRQLVRLLILLVSVGVITSPTWAESEKVNKTMFGDAWPLVVSEGTLTCDRGKAITFMANRKTYAVNGTARANAKDMRWLDVKEIWADDPQFPGLKKISAR